MHPVQIHSPGTIKIKRKRGRRRKASLDNNKEWNSVREAIRDKNGENRREWLAAQSIKES